MKRIFIIAALAIGAASCLLSAGPNAPADLRAEYNGASGINLYWPAATSTTALVGGYNIYRSTTAALTDAQWAASYLYATAPSGTTVYADTLPDMSQTYFYKLGAFDINSVSGPLSVTAAVSPYPPALSPAVAYNSRIVLSWPASPDPSVASYNIYRSTSPDILQASLLSTSQSNIFFDDLAANLVTYYYRVNAVSTGTAYYGAYSVAVTGTAFAPPFAVPSPVTSVSGADITLSWSASGARGSYDISGYDIYRNGSPTPITFTAGPQYKDPGLPVGATYNYSIVAQDIYSNLSPPAYFPPAYVPGQPSAPSGLTATTAAYAVNLSWAANNPLESVTAYDVYRDSVYLTTYPVMNQSTVDSFSDTLVSVGENHTYYLDAQNSFGTSAACAPISVTVLPSTPGLFSAARSLTPGAVDMSWNMNTDAAAPQATPQYYLFRSVSPTAINFAAAPYAPGLTNTSYTDAVVTPGITYNYSLSAVYNSISGVASSVVSVKPALFPVSQAAITAQPFNGMILLSWPAASAIYDPTGYNIYSSKDGLTYSDVTIPVTALYYPVTGLTNGQNYYFKVTTLNSYGESTTVSAYAVNLTPYASTNPPSKVTNLAVSSPGDGTISLQWDASIAGTGTTAYDVYRSTMAGVYTSTPVITANNFYNETTLTVTVPVDYFYEVKAFGNGAEGPASDEGNTVPFYRPYPVSNLNGTTENQQIVLDWIKPAALGTYQSAFKYRIYRSTGQTGIDTGINLLQDNYTSLTYVDSNVNTAAGTYYYLVKSFDDYSNEDSSYSPFQVQFGAPLPPPPQIVAIAGANQVRLTWTNISAQYFNIYRSTVSGSYGAPIAYDVAFSTKTYTDTNLANGTTYYYIVKAVSSMGEGPPSTEVAATPYTALALPADPKIKLQQVNKKDIYIFWNPVTDGTFAAAYYNILRSNDDGGTYTQIASVTASAGTPTDLTDTATLWNTTYLYLIKAQDTAGNQDAVYPPSKLTLPLPQNKMRVFKNLLNLAAGETLRLRYYITEAGHLRVRIYTLSGAFVNELIDTQITDSLSADNPLESQDFYWDGTNRSGKKVASGLYLISMEIGADRVISKIAVVR
jgi:hypothetical protein